MSLTREHVHTVIDTYIRAWTTQDPDLILTIFTPDATYHERVLGDEPIRDHAGIRTYWMEKVVGAQDDITCKLLSLYLDGQTAVAEWEAEFDDLTQQVRKRIREVAILDFADDRRISALREYWSSQEIPVAVG
jgi:SnoaL-like domain